MEIGEVFYPTTRPEWRDWLEENHATKDEIWVRRFKKAADMPSISYDDLVEECLCFGWIDGTIKRLDEESHVQRITPRRKKSILSELNRQRVWKLEAAGLLTEAGRAPPGRNAEAARLSDEDDASREDVRDGAVGAIGSRWANRIY
jgi:uncharacterized protein YdeI (YjbR/CyaY-like superfamily)